MSLFSRWYMHREGCPCPDCLIHKKDKQLRDLRAGLEEYKPISKDVIPIPVPPPTVETPHRFSLVKFLVNLIALFITIGLVIFIVLILLDH